MKILILGGGISGLSAAWYALQAHPDASITLLEATDRLGGWIDTRREGDFCVEMGPRIFPTARSPLLLQLIEELGLKQELLFSSPPTERRFLWSQNQLRPLTSFWPLFPRALWTYFRSAPSSQEESVYDFAVRRWGTKVAEQLVEPMILGIFGGDIRRLSLPAAFPTLAEWDQKGSLRTLFRSPPSPRLFGLQRGMGSLVETLSRLPIEIHLNTKVEELCPDGVVAGGRFWSATKIVSALPVESLAPLAKVPNPVPSTTIQVISLCYSTPGLLPLGLGYLVPTIEGESLLGMVWDSSRCSQATAMVRSGVDGLSIALDAMGRHLNVEKGPDKVWSKETSIPQYELGHRARVTELQAALRRRFPLLELAGNYLEGPSVEACLKKSKQIFNNESFTTT